ncbi:hypothetical protein EG329_003434 [Mollisiaceae sp. DMI_Dod_QoI]|nr:hypothetical protein EG329_003434 [Helotiales sp. DMI_Dod_QoI]
MDAQIPLQSFSEAILNHSQPSQLCLHCRHIFDHWDEVLEDEYTVRFPHCKNIFGLVESATKGCHLCSQFLRNLETRGIAKTLKGVTVDLMNSGRLGYNGYIIVISFERIISRGRDYYKDCWLLELRFRPPDEDEDEEDDDDEEDEEDEEETDGEDEIPEDGPSQNDDRKMVSVGQHQSDARISYEWPYDHVWSNWPGAMSRDAYACKVVLIPSSISEIKASRLSPDSRAALRQARQWLLTCCQSHPQCNIPRLSKPTRLVSLEGDRIRICNSTSLDEREQYATLSHCWGSLKILKLTKHNRHLLSQGVPLTALCKTFHDAILITLSLGIRYIWIDSLCIIQDDPTDWANEAKFMSDVYSGGAINIAASSASDGSGGCFFSRDPTHVWQHTIATHVDGQSRIYDCIEDGIFDACVFETPLSRRAWVMQERLLAPRTLHFSSTQLFWECNTLNACEVFPEKYPASLSYGDFYLQKQPISRSLWWKIVKLYSICELTYDRDKLVAISGIARKIVDQDKDAEYVAGLWRSEIENQLCWKIRASSDRPVTPQAPSWSWAAVNGTTSLPSLSECRSFIRVLDVDLGSHDPFGEVPSGTLTVSCQELHYVPHVGADQLLTHTKVWGPSISWDYKEVDPSWTFLLPVRIGRSLGKEYVSGLVLKETKQRQGEYCRVGHFEQLAEDFDDLRKHLLPSTQFVSRSGEILAQNSPGQENWRRVMENVILLV